MRKDDNLPPYCAVVKNSRSHNFLDPSGLAWPVTGVLYLYLPRISRRSDKFNFQVVFIFCIVIYYIISGGCPYILSFDVIYKM